jgi:hypothetical protein
MIIDQELMRPIEFESFLALWTFLAAHANAKLKINDDKASTAFRLL